MSNIESSVWLLLEELLDEETAETLLDVFADIIEEVSDE